MRKSAKVLTGALVTAGVAAGVAAAAAGGLVLFASRRMPAGYQRKMDEKRDRKEKNSRYADVLETSRDWLRSQSMEEVEITSADGLKLKGHLLLHPETKRTVLLLHGWRVRWDQYMGVFARSLYEQGCSVLLAEQRACGQSEGTFLTFGVKERYDCQRWAEYLAERFGREMPLYLAGLSMGAATVLMAADLALPPSVRGLIADSGFTSAHEVIASVMHSNLHLPEWPILPLANRVSHTYAGFGYDDCSTIDTLRGSKIPVLFIHGDADDFVPLAMTLENYLACAAPKELLIVEGAGHAGSFYVDPEACSNAFKKFFARFDDKK